MEIDKLNIIIIYPNGILKDIKYTKIKEPSLVKHIEINIDNFIIYLNSPSCNFLNHIKNNMYILKKGSYFNIKNIFIHINEFNINLGKDGNQKIYMLSTFDFRLSSYLLIVFNFNYKLVNYFSSFNHLPI